MRFPLSWLAEYVDLPPQTTGSEIAQLLTSVGFEEEEIIATGGQVNGPLVVGKVLEFVEEPQSNGKTIRWCQVETASGEVRGIVCGASNFFVGDKVVVSLPGAVLPGGFAITSRKTYGHTSDGMICSARELNFSEDHEGILRLTQLGLDPDVGTDAIGLLGLVDEVIDVSVLPDRGYAMSMRGLAREIAAVTGWAWNDPALFAAPVVSTGREVRAEILDPTAAQRIVLRTLEGFNPNASSPAWMQRRLHLCGMRSISLAVDITNYVMLELGQPLHAFDADLLNGHIRVTRSNGEVLKTLDEVDRTLAVGDIVIADDSGSIALAGTMGGASTEIHAATTRMVIEAACFSFTDVARTSRAHKLSSEASRRFERGVDSALAPVASARAVQLLTELGGACEIGASEVDSRTSAQVIALDPKFPAQYVGADYTEAEVRSALERVGCEIDSKADCWAVTVPSWRTDLNGPADLTEEVARLIGYDRIPSIVPLAVGGGLTEGQRTRRRVADFLAASGVVEVLNYPFTGDSDFDALRVPLEDSRRTAISLANPISAEQPNLRTTLLPGLLTCSKRNFGRGATDVALFEMGLVVLPDSELKPASRPSVTSKPSAEELAELKASVPYQPRYVAGVLSGNVELGLVKSAQSWDWQNTISLAVGVADRFAVTVEARAIDYAPWHPGRTAAILLADSVIGFAGELHPKVLENLGLPARTCAFELDLDALEAARSGVKTAQQLKTYPVARFDLAFVVDETTAAEDVRKALFEAVSELAESVKLFDVFRGQQVGVGKKSLAFTLTLRSGERTLEEGDLASAREQAVSRVVEMFGATLR